jgi:hypothetical protein
MRFLVFNFTKVINRRQNMRPYIYVSLTIALAVMLNVTIQAHHSIPVYWDEDKTIEISGVVKSMKVINPHSELIVTVTAANGQPEDWIGVSGQATQMIRAGWTNATLKAGTPVKVEGAPPRKQGAKGILVRKITLSDGRVLTSGRID